MGGWKLEVAKMAMYMTFPVALFHYFNQPQYFEEWVTKMKRELYPPEKQEIRAKFEETIKQVQEMHELKMLRSLEEKKN